jgi:hypothetical protein
MAFTLHNRKADERSSRTTPLGWVVQDSRLGSTGTRCRRCARPGERAANPSDAHSVTGYGAHKDTSANARFLQQVLDFWFGSRCWLSVLLEQHLAVCCTRMRIPGLFA